MSELLIDVNKAELVESGIVKSLHKAQCPLWIDGSNVVFEDGAVGKSPGYSAVRAAPETTPVIGMQDTLDGTTPWIHWGYIESLYSYNGTSLETTTGYTGSLGLDAFQEDAFQSDAFIVTSSLSPVRATQWSMESWGKWCIATNGISTPQVNKIDTNGFVNLGGTPPSTAQIVVRLLTYIVFFNTSSGNNYANWCDTDDVENWTTGDAGSLVIRELDSEIIAAKRMRDFIAVYSYNSMAILRYIGTPYIFGAKKVLEGIGAVSKHSVVEQGNSNYGISKQGIWKTDGTAYNYISPPFIRRWITDNVDFQQGFKIAGFLNENRNTIEWGLPLKSGDGNNSITLAYNYTNNSWTFKSYGLTAGVKKGIFPYPVFGTATGDIFYGEYGWDADGVAMDSWIQTKPLHGDNQLTWKSLEVLVTQVKDLVGTLQVAVGTQDDLNDAIVWGNYQTISDDSAPLYLGESGRMPEGKFVSFKFRSNELAATFGIAGFSAFGSIIGSEF